MNETGGSRRSRLLSVLLDNVADDFREIGPALSDLLRRTVSPRRNVRIADRAALVALIDEHASHLAQSSVYAYCRARTGFMAPKLFDEAPFIEGVEIAKWEAFGACLSDLLLVVEGLLRDDLPIEKETRARIFAALHEDILAVHEVPTHRLDWNDVREGFARRIAWATNGAPKSADDVAEASGRVVFAFVPFHENMLRPDEEMVINSVRFRMVRTCEDIAACLDRAALGTALTGG